MLRLMACGALLGSLVYAEEVLDLDVISYQDFIARDPQAISHLETALHEKGIVAIKGIPGCGEITQRFIEANRAFSALPETVKDAYAPNRERGDLFLGYEKGKEKFKRPNGTWVIDDLKASYYGFVPDNGANRWPVEVDLQTPFEEMGGLMFKMGKSLMETLGLFDAKVPLSIEGISHVGRMLYYCKSTDSAAYNPFWCGAHFDHSVVTVLIPAFYFLGQEAVAEPMEAGLFVRPAGSASFKKVIVRDPDLLLFQVGEFGQLITDDAILATEHRVEKASGSIERYTMALFFEAPMDMTIYSTSQLTKDARYGGDKGDPCSYRHWAEESFKRYIVHDPN